MLLEIKQSEENASIPKPKLKELEKNIQFPASICGVKKIELDTYNNAISIHIFTKYEQNSIKNKSVTFKFICE